MDLKEWMKVFLQARDAMHRHISGFEDKGGDFVVKKATGDCVVLVRPELSQVDDIISSSGCCYLAVLNKKKNLDTVLANWQKLAQKKELCIFFVNPVANEKWLLYPFTHNSITDKSALKRGLESLFSAVPAV